MSTIQRVNFEPVGDIISVTRRDFPVADKTLVIPTNAAALVDGEWLTLDSTRKLVRSVAIATEGTAASASKLHYPLFMERGRTDVQGSADKKTMILWGGFWEFDTRIFKASLSVGSGAIISAIDQPLKVASIDLGGKIVSGLVGHGGSGDTDRIVGYVTALPAQNGGKLRLRGGLLY